MVLGGACRLSSCLSAGSVSLQVFTGVGGSPLPPPAQAAICAGRDACRSPAVCLPARPEACEVLLRPDRCVPDTWKVGGRVPEGVPGSPCVGGQWGSAAPVLPPVPQPCFCLVSSLSTPSFPGDTRCPDVHLTITAVS